MEKWVLILFIFFLLLPQVLSFFFSEKGKGIPRNNRAQGEPSPEWWECERESRKLCVGCAGRGKKMAQCVPCADDD